MREHTKIYLQFFGYKIPEDCTCEICNKPSNDLHHIHNRKMGGDPTGKKDVIENLMALCRFDHEIYGDVPDLKNQLTLIHLKFMKYNGLKSELNKLIPCIDSRINKIILEINK